MQNNDNRASDRNQTPNRPPGNQNFTKKMSFSEYKTDIKTKYFKDTYPDLLNLKTSEKLDLVFSDIETFVKEVGSKLSVSQLRNVYSKFLAAKNLTSLKLTRPGLAYIAARQDKNIDGKKVLAFIDDLIQNVNDDASLDSFKKTMEAIVAYHKFYSDKN